MLKLFVFLLLQEFPLLAKSVLGALGNSRVATREVGLVFSMLTFGQGVSSVCLVPSEIAHGATGGNPGRPSSLSRKTLVRGWVYLAAGLVGRWQYHKISAQLSAMVTHRTNLLGKERELFWYWQLLILDSLVQMAPFFEELWTITVKLMDDMASNRLKTHFEISRKSGRSVM